MVTIGITGGIGMGKSTAEKLLIQRGIPVIDTDRVARNLVEPGQPALADIVHAFGGSVLRADRLLDRAALARCVFADSAARSVLEGILHPRIREAWLRQMASWNLANHPVTAVVIPLLFETNAESDLDITVCVACTPTTQLERLRARELSSEQIHQRIKAQLPVETKLARARYVIWTEGTIEVHAQQWDRVLQRIAPGNQA